jgi:hypothetical protein
VKVAAVRPVDGSLVLVVAWSHEWVAEEVTITIDGLLPSKVRPLPGEPMAVHVGEGLAGQVFTVEFFAAPSVDVALGLRSVLLLSDPEEAERLITRCMAARARLAQEQADRERSLMAQEQAARDALAAMRDVLDDVTSSPSWRLTRPLRSAKRWTRGGRTSSIRQPGTL